MGSCVGSSVCGMPPKKHVLKANGQCPCGAGRKYKNCCGAPARMSGGVEHGARGDEHTRGRQSVLRAMQQPNRTTKPNEPCPCGSGLKYKRCCGDASIGSEGRGTGSEGEMRRLCMNCKIAAKHKCSKCRAVYYCSQDCLRVDWSSHKANCAKLRDARDARKYIRPLLESDALCEHVRKQLETNKMTLGDVTKTAWHLGCAISCWRRQLMKNHSSQNYSFHEPAEAGPNNVAAWQDLVNDPIWRDFAEKHADTSVLFEHEKMLCTQMARFLQMMCRQGDSEHANEYTSTRTSTKMPESEMSPPGLAR